MKHRGDYVEELLSTVDDLFPEHPILEELWDAYDDRGFLTSDEVRRLEKMMHRGMSAA